METDKQPFDDTEMEKGGLAGWYAIEPTIDANGLRKGGEVGRGVSVDVIDAKALVPTEQEEEETDDQKAEEESKGRGGEETEAESAGPALEDWRGRKPRSITFWRMRSSGGFHLRVGRAHRRPALRLRFPFTQEEKDENQQQLETKSLNLLQECSVQLQLMVNTNDDRERDQP